MAKAVRYDRYGDPDVLQVIDLPDPEPGPGQVRVAVRATTVNPADWKIRRGLWAGGRPLEGEAGTGLELAGTVDAVGSDVTSIVAGQDVFGRPAGGGAAATRVLAPAGELVAKPEWLSFELAATLPVAGETAVRAVRLLDVTAGQTLLIHAVAGGVGLTAAQLAVSRGATVIGTAGASRHDFLRSRGIEPVVYGDGLADRVAAAAPHGIDAVLDASGRGEIELSVTLVSDPAKVLTIVDAEGAQAHGARYSGGPTATRVPPDEVAAEVLPLLRDGRLVMPVAATFPLERIADAHRSSEQGHGLGRIVITVG